MKLENVTDSAKRRYDDACGAAHGLDLLGERWSLLVVRELMFGPKRFSDLRHSLPGISANTLTQRLDGLEAAGVLLKRRLPPPASVSVYELTPWGYEAEPILQVFGRWAARSPAHDPALPISAASLLLSLRTMLDMSRVGEFRVTIGFEFGAEAFVATLDEDGLAIRRGETDGAGVTLAGDSTAVAAVIYGGAPLDGIEIRGDAALARRFVTLFPLPEKATRPKA